MNEATYEILINLQQNQAELKAGQRTIKAELQAIRGQMLTFQADINNLYSLVQGLDTRLERIEHYTLHNKQRNQVR